MSSPRLARLSRREMLALILGAPLASQLSHCSPAQPNKPLAGELLGQNHVLGHRLQRPPPSDYSWLRLPPLRHEVLVVGSGPAGLTAAFQLTRAGVTDVQLLELEAYVGGTSHSGRSETTPYPWAAHYLTCPMAANVELCSLLQEMGVVHFGGPHSQPTGRAPYLVAEPKERHFYKGFFYPGLYRYAGASPTDLNELQRFEQLVDSFATARDSQGRRAFALPVADSSTESTWTQLDQIDAARWLQQQGLRSERLHWLLEYGCRDDFGLRLRDTSAWALVHYHASRRAGAEPTEQPVLTWAQGNGVLVDHLRAGLRTTPATGKLVLDVVEHANTVSALVYDTASGSHQHYQGAQAIIATPQFIAQRIVAGLRQGPRLPPNLQYGAWLVANLHLRSRPDQRGSEPSWDTVLVDSPSLGYVCATHQLGPGHGATVWTYYLPMTDTDPRAGRQRLFTPNLKDFQNAILADLSRAHPDLRAHVERIDVFRWGHAMAQPRPGLLHEGKLAAAAEPIGSVHFAHSDLSGMALFEEAFFHGTRAARAVIRQRDAAS